MRGVNGAAARGGPGASTKKRARLLAQAAALQGRLATEAERHRRAADELRGQIAALTARAAKAERDADVEGQRRAALQRENVDLAASLKKAEAALTTERTAHTKTAAERDAEQTRAAATEEPHRAEAARRDDRVRRLERLKEQLARMTERFAAPSDAPSPDRSRGTPETQKIPPFVRRAAHCGFAKMALRETVNGHDRDEAETPRQPRSARDMQRLDPAI